MRRCTISSIPRVLALATLALGGCAGSGITLDDVLRTAGMAPGTGGSPDLVAGLREALQVGTERTVSSTSRRDGFLADPRIRIPLPEQLEPAARGLRAAGFGSSVDELEVAMNRAAERAAAEATPVFVSAIRGLTFADARAILDGGERAATDYFERRTRDQLFARFSPIVDSSMREVGLVQVYDRVIGEVQRIPFLGAPELDLRAHVTDRGLDGLFAVLAREEARIRTDPAARTTELLRSVFGPG